MLEYVCSRRLFYNVTPHTNIMEYFIRQSNLNITDLFCEESQKSSIQPITVQQSAVSFVREPAVG